MANLAPVLQGFPIPNSVLPIPKHKGVVADPSSSLTPAVNQDVSAANSSEVNKKAMEQLNDIFNVCKKGWLVPIQELVEAKGIGILSQYDDNGHTPIHWAALGGNTHAMRYFVEIKAPLDIPGKNPLAAHPIHWACVNGHISIVAILLQAGISIDCIDNKGCTPLIIAAQYGRTMLAGFLMGKGARLQITDKEGDNALHWAAFKGQCELTRLLIHSGFDPCQKDSFGQQPLHLASLSGDLMTVKLLCELDGANVELKDHNGNTPLQLAKGRKHQDIVTYFQSKLKQSGYLAHFDFKSIVFGPPGKNRFAFMFLICITCLYGYPVYLLKVLPHTTQFFMSHRIFLMNTIFMWYTLIKAHNTDPGFLPKNVDDYDQALKQVAVFDEWKQGQNPLSRLCHTCRLVRPLRAKHCRVTNRCVKHFDHYCPYIYNVVGYRNRHYFVGFLIGMFITLLYGDYFVWHMCRHFGFDLLLVVGGVIMAGFTFIVFGLTFFTIYQAVKNITTNERLNSHRYEYLKDGNGRFYNPFDQGVVANLKEYFHLKQPLSVVIDHAGQADVQLV